MNLVKKSLLLCIGLLLALIALQAAQSLWQVSRLAGANGDIVASADLQARAKNLYSGFLDTEHAFKQAIAFVDAASADDLRKTFGDKAGALREQVQALQGAAVGDVQGTVQAVSAKVDSWLALAAPHVGASGVTELPSYHRLDAAHEELHAEIGTLVERSAAASALAVAASQSLASHAYLWTLVELAAAVALGLFLGRFALKSLHQQLGADASEVARVANAVADGDLSVPIRADGVPAASVMAAMARMQQALLGTVARVRSISEGLAGGVHEIASGNADLSRRTEQQASALEKAAATMRSLDQAVRHNTDNAHQAGELAERASGVAAHGGSVVEQAVVTMGGINDASKKIADIIGVIDGIAFQTNILALNAAVEAARAGEQGRGFAVVAAEVRALAQRSAAAAKEIKALIHTSVERVEAGSALVDQAGRTMQEVVQAIERVTGVMRDIRSASSAQSEGVAQAGLAIGQIDQTTQQNAALAEESAAAAESLSVQGRQLVEAVSFFRLAHEQAGVRVGPQAPAIELPPAAASWDGADRRGPGRARNVVRPAFGRSAAPAAAGAPRPAASAATGTDGAWETL